MRILYKFASRSRPEKFFKCLSNIIEMAGHDDYKILCSIDTDDHSMNNSTVLSLLEYNSRVILVPGTSANKIEAINRDIETVADWDILMTHADDFRITRKGFDLKVIADMQQYFPDLDGLLHYPDQQAKKRLITYAIMGRKYYDRFRYIYNPEYNSLFADNEQQAVAKRLNCYQYIDEMWVEHQHPIWTNEARDALLNHNESFYKADREIYRRRLDANFDLNPIL